MGDKTGIEWTDATWNPTTGCDRVSKGCSCCYAMAQAPRLKAMNAALGKSAYQRDGDPRTSGPGFGVDLRPERLDQPLRWTKPRMIFVDSMSDLFHKEVDDSFIAQVFAVMALTPRHTFQLLTKRHARMRSLVSSWVFRDAVESAIGDFLESGVVPAKTAERFKLGSHSFRSLVPWPLPNLWLGVSVEDQAVAELRIPALFATPAAIRWISAEPLLGAVDLTKWISLGSPTLDWLVAGGESGPGARPMHPSWARALRDQCTENDIPFMFKQWGAWLGQSRPGDPWLEREPDGWVAADDGSVLGEDEAMSDTSGRHFLAMFRVGKKVAGRDLDGRTWDEYPTARTNRPRLVS